MVNLLDKVWSFWITSPFVVAGGDGGELIVITWVRRFWLLLLISICGTACGGGGEVIVVVLGEIGGLFAMKAVGERGWSSLIRAKSVRGRLASSALIFLPRNWGVLMIISSRLGRRCWSVEEFFFVLFGSGFGVFGLGFFGFWGSIEGNTEALFLFMGIIMCDSFSFFNSFFLSGR